MHIEPFSVRTFISFLLTAAFLIPGITSSAQEKPACDSVDSALKLSSLDLGKVNREWLHEGLTTYQHFYRELRKYPLTNQVPPAVWFNPIPVGKEPAGYLNTAAPETRRPISVSRPANIDLLAYYPVSALAELIRSRQVSSLELTKFFLDRLKKYNSQLNCVITFTEDLAIATARKADAEIAQGIYRGPLQGIPFGVKDLLAVKGYPTTWGAAPYKTQQFDESATVVKQLQDAGAVLLAKMSLGELAMDDIWFGGLTRNPWDPEQGSSGSSAGSASAVSAGLLPFAIGSETWGSIVSPATRCGVTGLRPTYGRVSRTGAMALSWTMDKIGPICRNAEDCALILDVISKKDPRDPAQFDLPFVYPCKTDLKKLRVGYLKSAFENDTVNRTNNLRALESIRKMGMEPVSMELPDDLPVQALALILEAEAATAFDELTRSGKVDELTRQEKGYWPDLFRRARFIPAVEYLQANRFRTQLITEFDALFNKVDIIVSPSMDDTQSLMTNLTGNPCIVVPNGLYDGKHPGSISFIGKLFSESLLISFAKVYQDATPWDKMHPPLFAGE